MLDRHHRAHAVADLIRGRTVLDVGAGTRLLEPLVDGWYAAVDVSPTSLATADRAVAALAEKLPFRDQSFETVVCVSVLQYVIDVQGAVQELRRVTQQDGQLLILVPNFAYARHRLRLGIGRLPSISAADSWRHGTIRNFTLPDLKPMLEELRLRPSRVRCSGRFGDVRSRWPTVLGADLILDLELLS